MEIMSSRYESLAATLAGYEKAQIPLVAINSNIINNDPYSASSASTNGITFFPSGRYDDPGSYYFIPKLAQLFNLNLDASISLFYYGITTLAFIVALWTMIRTFKSKLSQFITTTALILLSLIIIKLGDAYVLSGAIPMALIPCWLYLYKSKISFKKMLFFFLILGLIVGISNFIRSHAGTGALLFILVMLLFNKIYSWKQKISYSMAIIIGLLSVSLYFGHLLKERDNFLLSINPNYEAVRKQHHFWHSVYLGFGYLNNEHGIVYLDENALNKVASIDSTAKYSDKTYESILKNEVFNLVRNDISFVSRTIFSKLGVCLMYLLIFTNLGLVCAIFYRKEWLWQIAFGVGLSFYALNGILVMPFPNYLLGFIALATLYGVYNLGYFIDHNLLKKDLSK